jgi:hypothetical protein
MPTIFPPWLLTRHAMQRCQQRGIPLDALDLVHAFGDIDVPASGGCVRRLLSHRASVELLADGWPPALVDRAARLTLIVADNGEVVSTWPRHATTRRIDANRRRARSGSR